MTYYRRKEVAMSINNLYRFDLEIYPRILFVLIGMDDKAVKEYFSNINVDDLQPLPSDTSDACTYQFVRERETRNLGALVVFKSRKCMDIKTITHESFHVLDAFVKDLDLDHDGTNNEHLAYLLGWIASKIEEAKNNKQNYSKLEKNGKD